MSMQSFLMTEKSLVVCNLISKALRQMLQHYAAKLQKEPQNETKDCKK